MSGGGFHSSFVDSGPLPAAASAGESDPVSGARGILRRLFQVLVGRGRASGVARSTAFRPVGEGLASRTLLSDVLVWSGGSAGNPNSVVTPANIANLTEQYSHQLDGQILAEPVTATVDIAVGPSPGAQPVVFVATENNSLHAFSIATGQLLWQTNFLKPGETTLPNAITQSDVPGITGTPVIDPSTNTLYLVTTESYITGNFTHYTKTLHAVDLSNGTERPGSPVIIADTGYKPGKVVSRLGPSVRGAGAGSSHRRLYFYAERQLQRVALSLVGNNLVIGFGSFGDLPPEHGWILAYNKASLQLTGVFNDTPNGSDGGIWNSGGPIQADSQGFLYTETGNGTFDTRLNRRGFPSRADYGDSVLKLALVPGYKGPNGTGFKVVDYFTPHDQAKLAKHDGDLASSGVLILPIGAGGPAHPNLLLASGKSGAVYVIDRNHMGHFHKRSDKIVQLLAKPITGSFDTPAYFDNTVYYAGINDVPKSFKVINGQLVQTGQAPGSIPWPGANPAISSAGTNNGIVWVISGSKQLIAYDARDLSRVLWSAPLPGYSKFSVPTLTDDGHVEVGAGSVLVGFGLG
jgi:outer membrane protein assembly factor BamB